MKKLFILCLLAFATMANAQIRNFSRTTDVSRAGQMDLSPVTFYRGEQVQINLTLTQNGLAYTNQNGAISTLWFGSPDNIGGGSLLGTGIVTLASTTMIAPPPTTSMPATNGWTWAELYIVSGNYTNFLGVVWRARCTVLDRTAGDWITNAWNYAPVGPQGPQGATGPIGPAGTNGLNGTNYAINLVASVYGRTGDVVALSGDYTASQVGSVATNDARYLAALTNASAFATAAQGAKADTALQPNGVNGTDPVGNVVANGQVTTVGSSTPWTGLGYVTQTVTNGLPSFAASTNIADYEFGYNCSTGLFVSGGGFTVDAIGNVQVGSPYPFGGVNLNADGSFMAGAGDFTMDKFGLITSDLEVGGSYAYPYFRVYNTDGSFMAASGNFAVDANGNINPVYGNVQFFPSGDGFGNYAYFDAQNYIIGPTGFGMGGRCSSTFDPSTGSFYVNINDGSFFAANNSFSVDASGNLICNSVGTFNNNFTAAGDGSITTPNFQVNTYPDMYGNVMWLNGNAANNANAWTMNSAGVLTGPYVAGQGINLAGNIVLNSVPDINNLLVSIAYGNCNIDSYGGITGYSGYQFNNFADGNNIIAYIGGNAANYAYTPSFWLDGNGVLGTSTSTGGINLNYGSVVLNGAPDVNGDFMVIGNNLLSVDYGDNLMMPANNGSAITVNSGSGNISGANGNMVFNGAPDYYNNMVFLVNSNFVIGADGSLHLGSFSAYNNSTFSLDTYGNINCGTANFLVNGANHGASIISDTTGNGGTTLQLNAQDNGQPMYLHVTSLGVATWTTAP